MVKVAVIDEGTWKTRFIVSLSVFVIGVLLAVGGRGSLSIILMISGALIALTSIVVIADSMKAGSTKSVALGVAGFVLGVALVAAPNLFSGLLMLILAAMLILLGIAFLLGSSSMGILGLVTALILIVVGVYALFNLESTADVVMVIIGVLIALTGLMGMAGALGSR